MFELINPDVYLCMFKNIEITRETLFSLSLVEFSICNFYIKLIQL